MTQREQIGRDRVRAQIHVQDTPHGHVCIFCPTEVSAALHRHFAAKQIFSEEPRRTVFSRYPEDVLIATLSFDAAMAEIREFVAGLPEVCYERAVKSH